MVWSRAMATAPRRRPVRFAALVLACLLAAFGVFTYLAYTAAFVSTATITVTASRAGLMLSTGAKVKYRGIQVGKVEGIDYAGDQAKLTLAIDTGQLRYIPSNARVRIGGDTVFGAKAVEFLPPAEPSPTPLQPGASVQTSAVQRDVNTLFETLIELLHKIDPVNLNATLEAVGEGLRNHGEDLGAALAGLNHYLLQVNPKMPTVRSDFARTATVANTYADASQDLVTVLNDAPTIANTILEERDNLNATLLAAIGLADNGTATLEPAADTYIAAIQRLRAPLKVLSDYSPEFGCVFQGLKQGIDKFGVVIGGTKPGLFVSGSFVPGVPIYTYPESLPIVNATGGPNCRGLPNMPSKQFGGSWFHSPFLVTDNAYIPYEPFTEVQVDAPSTLQFLFNGAFAERDDF